MGYIEPEFSYISRRHSLNSERITDEKVFFFFAEAMKTFKVSKTQSWKMFLLRRSGEKVFVQGVLSCRCPVGVACGVVTDV
jgi:hypothetical protein